MSTPIDGEDFASRETRAAVLAADAKFRAAADQHRCIAGGEHPASDHDKLRDAADDPDECERPDCQQIANTASEVYCDITGGLLSYPTYDARTILAHANDETQKLIDEESAALREQIASEIQALYSDRDDYDTRVALRSAARIARGGVPVSWNPAECDACSRPVDAHVVMGCVHEHMGEVRFCTEHRARLDGPLDCVPCINDHSCRVRIVRWLSDDLAVSR